MHDGIHYNLLRLRDNQEEGEQNKESNNKECINNTQQRRTKEHATPIIQYNPSEEHTHGKGDGMRATNASLRTQDNTQENIHEKEDEVRTTKDNTKEEIHVEQDEMRTTN